MTLVDPTVDSDFSKYAQTLVQRRRLLVADAKNDLAAGLALTPLQRWNGSSNHIAPGFVGP